MTAGTIIRSFAAPVADGYGLTWDGSRLWVSAGVANLAYQISPVTGTLIRTLTSPGAGTNRGLAWDGWALWEIAANNGPFQIIPTTGTPVRFFASIAATQVSLTWDGSYLWFATQNPGILHKMSPVTGTVVHTIPAPTAFVGGLAWNGSTLFVAATNATISEVDPVAGTIIRTFAIANRPRDITWDGRTLWYIEQVGPQIHQVLVN